MKKAIVFLFLLFSIQISAQVIVDGVNINERNDVQIVQVIAVQKALSRNVVISVDYGQDLPLFATKGTQVEDRRGKKMVFNGVVDALNFMERNGWEYKESMLIAAGNQYVYQYIFKRKL